jgi:hypothetical protein
MPGCKSIILNLQALYALSAPLSSVDVTRNSKNGIERIAIALSKRGDNHGR